MQKVFHSWNPCANRNRKIAKIRNRNLKVRRLIEMTRTIFQRCISYVLFSRITRSRAVQFQMSKIWIARELVEVHIQRNVNSDGGTQSFRLIRLRQARAPRAIRLKAGLVGRGVRQKGLTVRSSHAMNVFSIKRIQVGDGEREWTRSAIEEGRRATERERERGRGLFA